MMHKTPGFFVEKSGGLVFRFCYNFSILIKVSSVGTIL